MCLPDSATRPHAYLSTACWHEQADSNTAMHAACRQTCKFCGASCACPAHAEGAAEPPQVTNWVDQARDVATALLDGLRAVGIPLTVIDPDLDRRITADPALFWARGDVKPPGHWHAPDDPGGPR